MINAREEEPLPGIRESGPPLNPLPQNIKLPEGLKQVGTTGPKLLATERSKASFSVKDMANYIVGEENIARQARILDIIIKEEAFDKSRLPYIGRTEKFAHGVRKDKRMFQLAKEHNWNELDQRMAEDLIDMPSAYGLHKSMFLETLRSQTTDEQKKLFLEPALRYEMIGCYAQTEVGHGSNVQGLETTATYDNATQEFVIHSPTITASKFWIGGLGRTADVAIVMAQLYSNGKRRGIHPFLVPIRDKQSRKTLPGLTIGDIGPKAGYNTTDNGFMLFDNVRIPHVNMMARFSSIDPSTGNYNKPANQALAYGTMVFIRANIVRQSSLVLARAATVAIRYCAIRRQFTDRDAPQTDDRKPAESQVLNYQMVQYRLFPILATALAFHFCGQQLYRSYLANVEAMKKGDLTHLQETHASACALKCHVTIMGAFAIEECRRACGGHGFSSASGLGSQYADYLPQVTYEGDSYMLTQQCTRYLWKVFRALWNDIDSEEFGTENATVEYMRRYIKDTDAKSPVRYSGDFRNPQEFVNAFGHRAAFLVGTSLRRRDIEKKSWNSLLVEIDRASHAHSQFILVQNFAQVIMHDEKLAANPALHHVMTQCFELYAAYTMDKHAAEFLSSGYLSPAQHELLRNQVYELLATIRPQAVPLVDGFAIPDYLLDSKLGKYDGDVYPALLDFATREPLNAVEFNTDVNDTEIIIGQEKLAKL